MRCSEKENENDSIEKADLPEFLQDIKVFSAFSLEEKKIPLKEALRRSEKDIIVDILKECGDNRKKAAELLGINRTTLYNKMREYGLLDN